MACREHRWALPAAKLPSTQISMLHVDDAPIERCTAGLPYHARAGQRVPTEANAICVLNLAPLVLESLEVCHSGWTCLCYGVGGGRRWCLGNVSWRGTRAPTIRRRGAGGAQAANATALIRVDQLTAWLQQDQAATIPLNCKVYCPGALQVAGGLKRPDWQLRSSIPST